jgi:hypothetical protein
MERVSKFSENRFKQILYSILLFILFLSIYCGTEKTPLNSESIPPDFIPEHTDDGWETGNLTDAGINPIYLFNMLEYLKASRDHNVHSILIVKDDKLVFEKYYRGHAYKWDSPNFQGEYVDYGLDVKQNLHSVTKSITSICAGIAKDEGYLKSLDDSLFSFFPQYSHLSTPQKAKIKVKHVLSMTTGFEWNEWELPLSNTSNDLIQMVLSNDPIGYVLSKPVISTPGKTFYYNGGNTNLLGEIVRKSTGRRLDFFSETHLFTPLEISDFQWQYFGNWLVYASGDLYLRPRDMAKIGNLFLRKGIWNGTRIISEEWVDESTKEFISLPWVSWADAYGYQWWIIKYPVAATDIRVYFASGWGGQTIRVFPSLEMVVIMTGSNYVTADPIDFIITKYILPAVK